MNSPPTGVYIHWPYCDKICPYCDFNVVRNRNVDIAQWRRVLREDVAHWAEHIGRRSLSSVYFGGGTPSLMPPSLIASVLDELANKFDLQADAEVTLEANPTNVEVDLFERFRDAGVNRLSLGVQSFDDQQLAFLGRNHDGWAARQAVERSLAIFPRQTFDLIYGLPEENVEAWGKRLQSALAIGVHHLSAYQLTIEPNTAFANAVARGEWVPPSEETSAALYEMTNAETARAGLPAYEVSSYARLGEQAVHNNLYWCGGDWIGIGPGAHGRLTNNAGRWETIGQRNIYSYIRASCADRYQIDLLPTLAVDTEALAGGLRLVEGMSIRDISEPAVEAIAKARRRLVADGLLENQLHTLQVTPRGRLLIDALVQELVNELEY